MKNSPDSPKDVDEYINDFSPKVQEILKQIRFTIKEAAPEAKETIKYQMPTFFLNENLVHFAGYKGHIGFYPTPSGIEKFANDLTSYKYTKGLVQFPIDKPIPLKLIKKIVEFRVKEVKEKESKKKI